MIGESDWARPLSMSAGLDWRAVDDVSRPGVWWPKVRVEVGKTGARTSVLRPPERARHPVPGTRQLQH